MLYWINVYGVEFVHFRSVRCHCRKPTIFLKENFIRYTFCDSISLTAVFYNSTVFYRFSNKSQIALNIGLDEKVIKNEPKT